MENTAAFKWILWRIAPQKATANPAFFRIFLSKEIDERARMD